MMVHHTAVRLDDNRQAPARIRGHQRFHQSKGFVDIAYHVFVDAHGNVFEGRNPEQPGETFTDYDPAGWFLVVCEGNFDEQPLPEAQLDAMARVLAWASARYGVDPGEIASHRQHAHTRCPGEAIHALVVDGTLAGRVEDHLGATVVETCGPEAQATVAAIEAGSD
ncbi:MAG: N-acetylmuramoyl-L-alanine amidase [Actinobacteria bacterium]|nr:N-acetylmuramoyl-L-alanine amidase [Actinomycetota bacterium]